MYASACYDGVGQDFLTIISHINQQAERIAELDKCNKENWLSRCEAVDERDALRARVAELEQYKAWAEPQIARPIEVGVVEENNALRAEVTKLKKDYDRLMVRDTENLKDLCSIKAWRTWGRDVVLPAVGSNDWKRIDAAVASAPKDEP